MCVYLWVSERQSEKKTDPLTKIFESEKFLKMKDGLMLLHISGPKFMKAICCIFSNNLLSKSSKNLGGKIQRLSMLFDQQTIYHEDNISF